MVNKTKIFYDILTGVLILLWGILIILAFVFNGVVESKEIIFGIASLFVGCIIYNYVYSIAVIILAIMKQKGGSLVVIIIGSLIIPGFLPLVYYLFFIRKQLKQQNKLPSTI